MKLVITESQLKTIIEQQAVQQGTLTVPEQTLLGFLNRFLMGERVNLKILQLMI